MYIGSDILQVTYTSTEVGSGTFFCKAGEGSTIDLGGLRSDDDKQKVTGSGTKIDTKTMNRSAFELPPIAWDKTDKQELQKLGKLASATVGCLLVVQFIDGAIAQMQNAHPVGDIAGDGYEGTIAIVFQGDANASFIS